MDGSEELRGIVAQALESKGVLAKLRAQLRREVFTVLDEQEHGGTSPPAAALEKLNAFKATPEGASLLSLIAEFFDFFELECTLSIFQAEAKLDSRFHGRRAVAESLGMGNAQAAQPLLAEVYEGWSQGSGARPNAVSNHSASSPETALPPPAARDRKALSEDTSGGSRSASSAQSSTSVADFGSTRSTGARRSARVSMDDEIEALMSGGASDPASSSRDAGAQSSSTDSTSPSATSSSRLSASALAPLPTSKPPSKLGPLAPLGKPKLSELPPLSRPPQQHAETEAGDVLGASDDQARLQEVEGRMKQLQEVGVAGKTAAASSLQAPASAPAEASGEYEYADDFGQDGVQEEIDIEPETGESDYRFQASTSADGVDVGGQPSGFAGDARAPSGFRSTNYDYYEEMEHL